MRYLLTAYKTKIGYAIFKQEIIHFHTNPEIFNEEDYKAYFEDFMQSGLRAIDWIKTNFEEFNKAVHGSELKKKQTQKIKVYATNS